MCTPFRLVVLLQPFINVVSTTDVIRFVGTLEDIDEIMHMERVSFRRFTPQCLLRENILSETLMSGTKKGCGTRIRTPAFSGTS